MFSLSSVLMYHPFVTDSRFEPEQLLCPLHEERVARPLVQGGPHVPAFVASVEVLGPWLGLGVGLGLGLGLGLALKYSDLGWG